MRRHLRSLVGTRFDVLVIGAGIYGATIAWEAAQRGLSVALIDRGDFGAATSFNSLKTVHGGLRSLQRGSLREMREFIRERRTLLRVAPHLVNPLRFLVPTYGAGKRSRLVMAVALTLNDLVAHDRNAGLDPARHLAPSRTVSRDEVLALFPGLDPERVTGGATWHDGQMYNADRVLLAFVQSSARAGAVVANYVAATGFLRSGTTICGVLARDEVGHADLEIRARVTVNAAGAWAPKLAGMIPELASASLAPRMSKAVNLVTRLPAPACAIGDQVDGRFLFCVPWRGLAVFGTMHGVHEGPASRLATTAGEVETFLHDINRAFPAAGARPDDVTLVHQGLLPMDGVRGGEVQLTKTSVVHDHRAEGLDGLFTVVGVRYTTARDTAERVVDAVSRTRGTPARPSGTAAAPLSGGDIPDVARFLAEASRATSLLPAASLDRLARSYGTAYPRVVALVQADPALALPLGASCTVTRAEVLYGVREEMGMRLGDVVLRRSEAGSAGSPGRDALEVAAGIVGAELGWDPVRAAREIEDVEAVYRLTA